MVDDSKPNDTIPTPPSSGVDPAILDDAASDVEDTIEALKGTTQNLAQIASLLRREAATARAPG